MDWHPIWLERTKVWLQGKSDHIDILIKDRNRAALAGILYLLIIIFVLIPLDRHFTTCKQEATNTYLNAMVLAGLAFFFEAMLILFARKVHEEQKSFAKKDTSKSIDDKIIEWGHCLTPCSALRYLCCNTSSSSSSLQEDIIVLKMWLLYFLSLSAIFLPGPSGIGCYAASVIVDVLLFNPSDSSGAPYRLTDSGRLARIVVLVSFAIHHGFDDALLHIVFPLANIAWQYFASKLQGWTWGQRLYWGGFAILAIVEILIVVKSECPADSTFFIFIVSVPPAYFLTSVDILALWGLELVKECWCCPGIDVRQDLEQGYSRLRTGKCACVLSMEFAIHPAWPCLGLGDKMAGLRRCINGQGPDETASNQPRRQLRLDNGASSQVHPGIIHHAGHPVVTDDDDAPAKGRDRLSCTSIQELNMHNASI